jgi:hypothetical protein
MENNPIASPQAVQADVALYHKTLEAIFKNSLIGSNGDGAWSEATAQRQDVWRASWAFDTFIDYIKMMQEQHLPYLPAGQNEQQFIDEILDNALSPIGGLWWDDFGWQGIASLRAAEELTLTQEQRDHFFKRAVNAWSFMYGQWGGLDNSPEHFKVPFPEAGWKTVNIGAPNVYTYGVGKHPSYSQYKPRFSMGGIWNNELNGENPQLSATYSGDGSYLDPIQNTVTNCVFTLLSLRVSQAIFDPRFKPLMAKTYFTVKAPMEAWINQLNWLNTWMFGVDPDESLLQYPSTDSALVRERVSTFANNQWDTAFRKGLSWSGDQGLLVGILREAQVFIAKTPGFAEQHPELAKMATKVYPWILKGVLDTCYSDQGIPGLGVQLRPWINRGETGNEFGYFPQADDNGDYQTGSGVFYRYLRQLMDTQPALAANFAPAVFASANDICRPDFPAPGTSMPDCESFVSQYDGGNPFNDVTPWVNRMALLSLAIRLAE